MKIKTSALVAFCVILGIGSAAYAAVSRREVVINSLLSRTSRRALSSSASGSTVDLSTPFALPRALQGSLNQKDIFTKWKQYYGFSFKTSADEATVNTTFTEHLSDVVEHNQRYNRGRETHWKTLNGFSGLKERDFTLLKTGINTKQMNRIIRNLNKKRRSLQLRAARTRRTTTKKTTTTKRTTTKRTTTKKTTTTKRTTTKKTTTKKTTTTRPTTTKATTTTASTVTEVIVDHSTSKFFPAAKDQGLCGSCWAFAAVTPMEYQINMLYNITNTDLSEQQLVNCDKSNWGCNGGLPDIVYQNLINNGFGITSELAYPYTAKDATCSTAFKKENHKVTAQTGNVSGGPGGWGTGTEAKLEALVRKGPVVVAIYASTLSSYGGGIFSGCSSGLDPNHAVVVVGFGIKNGKPYWIVRNSWGTSWGNNGNFYMAKGSNMCNVRLYYIEPTVAVNP